LAAKVYRKITGGAEENLLHFYQDVKKEIESSAEVKEVKKEKELAAKAIW
jgi:hypothetical protein